MGTTPDPYRGFSLPGRGRHPRGVAVPLLRPEPARGRADPGRTWGGGEPRDHPCSGPAFRAGVRRHARGAVAATGRRVAPGRGPGECRYLENRQNGTSQANYDPIPLAKSAQAVARPAKREVRVAARGAARNQAARRSTLIAAAVATCWRWVLARPR